jgi:hypothetical protein
MMLVDLDVACYYSHFVVVIVLDDDFACFVLSVPGYIVPMVMMVMFGYYVDFPLWRIVAHPQE